MGTIVSTPNRWLVLISGSVFTFALSGTSAFSVFVSPLMEETSWDMGQITLAFTLYNIFIATMGIIVGTVAHKVTPGRIVFTGALFYGVGWVLTGFANSVVMMWLTFGVLAGIGGGMIYNYTITSVLKWFPDRRGLASGLVIGFAAVGPVFAAPVATAVIEAKSVFAGFIVLGIVYAALMFVFAVFVRPPAEGYSPAGWIPPGTDSSVPGGLQLNWREMMKTPTFWLLFFVFVGAGTSYMMMLGAAATIGKEQAGMSVELATISVTVVALSNFIGRMIFGALSDKLGREITLMIAMSVNVAAMLSMSVVAHAGLFLALMALVGASGGALLALFPALVSDQFGAKYSTLNYAIMFTAYSVAALIAPQLAAFYRQSGNYAPAFMWAAGLTVAAMGALGIVMKKGTVSQRRSK
ncbi:OFA family MFS transporter [Actinotignum schaalii]|uniref:Major facilitator superfamily (MFS) profile domain-containing protein n=1 Tax=Actinotignum schaalii FB123-CNA-2 TaxID=883067 RepID=S2VL09_9ACTO|nr:OFA family MFS transporter [Actinotignum schaalii]EPD26680.1 hypothetical protein HMPREF9237_01306 [Actinotignum schaalii FB123-CNA-2]